MHLHLPSYNYFLSELSNLYWVENDLSPLHLNIFLYIVLFESKLSFSIEAFCRLFLQ
jgi:hypothetical protein